MTWTKDERDTVQEILRAVSRIEAGCKPCREEVADHRLMLNGPPGNGTRPGLRSRVDSHDDNIATIEEDLATISRKYRTAVTWALRIAGGIIVSAAGVIIVRALN